MESAVSWMVRDLEWSAKESVESQRDLSEAVDRLTRQLDQLLEDAPAPFTMHYAAKISTLRKRVSSLNSLLKSIHRNLDNIDRLLSLSLNPNPNPNPTAPQEQT